ncbi:MAG: sensor histidine kinase [Subtercola sp.]|jgi:two-component system OmpR family sensor kinase|nr:sensor histidine kinase [Subtercola sp.]
MRSLSIRLRITIGSALVAAALLTLVGVAVHFQIMNITAGSDQTLATSDLESYISDLRNNANETPDKPAVGILVLIKDPAGAFRVDTVPAEVRTALQTHPSGDDTFVVNEPDGKYTVVGRSIATTTGVWQLWAVRSGATSELTVTAVDRALMVGLAAILVLFTFAAWLLTTLALRPVGRMRQTAETLSERPGDAELPVGPAHDELSALATTLNSFIRRMRNTAHRERQMVSDASHELRTPIAVMSTQLELAHTSFGDAAALEEEIIAAQASLSRLASLADNLLELSRLEAASETRQPHYESATAVELVTELMEAIDRARMLAGADHASIQFDASVTSQDQKYLLSAAAFGRVLDNLLVNAVNASGGAGEITVTLSQSATALNILVTDDGTGMPEEFLPHAFERFSQPEAARAPGHSGSGLGLALVHAVITRAEGTVTLVNRSPHGLDVSILIPNI